MIARNGAISSLFSPSILLSTRSFWAFALSAAFLVATSGLAFGAGTYYVDNSSPSCSNSGAGTEAQPYCTISAAVSARGGPGTTIYVKPGIYPEQVSINVSGVAGSPFVIQALGGPVTIEGAEDFSSPGSWAPYSGSVYLASSVTWAAMQVLVDATRLLPSTAAPAALPVNSFTYVAGQGLYVNLGGSNPGGSNPGTAGRSPGSSVQSRATRPDARSPGSTTTSMPIKLLATPSSRSAPMIRPS